MDGVLTTMIGKGFQLYHENSRHFLKKVHYEKGVIIPDEKPFAEFFLDESNLEKILVHMKLLEKDHPKAHTYARNLAKCLQVPVLPYTNQDLEYLKSLKIRTF